MERNCPHCNGKLVAVVQYGIRGWSHADGTMTCYLMLVKRYNT